MVAEVKNTPRVDLAMIVGILFWILVIAAFITIVSAGEIQIPRPVLEITEASASNNTLFITHREGDPVRFANTRCVWTPDTFMPHITEEAGSLVMTGKELKQGRVSKLEPGERATLEKKVNLQAGRVGRLLVLDLKSGRQIFTKTVKVSQ